MIIKSSPKRSIQNEKGVILDVYSLFLKNPKQLLYHKENTRISPGPLTQQPKLARERKGRGRPAQNSKSNASQKNRIQYADLELSNDSLSEIPLKIAKNENYDFISQEELDACISLKVTHAQYVKVIDFKVFLIFKARNILILNRIQKGYFKKREAQKLCRMDVNKTGKLFDYFVSVGWLEGREI